MDIFSFLTVLWLLNGLIWSVVLLSAKQQRPGAFLFLLVGLPLGPLVIVVVVWRWIKQTKNGGIEEC
jgi:ABC-type sugar transport system permease subunit